MWLSGLAALAQSDDDAAATAFNTVLGPGARGAGAQARARARLRAHRRRRRSPSSCTRSAPPPTRTTSPRLRSAWPGRANAATTSPARSRPSTSSRRRAARTRRRAVAGPSCSPPPGPGLDELAAAAASIDGIAIDPRERLTLQAQILVAALDSVERNGDQPSTHVGPAVATEPDLRAAAEHAYRELATLTSDRVERDPAGRRRQRRTTPDARVTESPPCAPSAGRPSPPPTSSARRAARRSPRPPRPARSNRSQPRSPDLGGLDDPAASPRRRPVAAPVAARSTPTGSARRAACGRRASATTSASSPRPTSRRCATREWCTRATRTRRRWPWPTPVASSWSATASPLRPTATSRRSRRPRAARDVLAAASAADVGRARRSWSSTGRRCSPTPPRRRRPRLRSPDVEVAAGENPPSTTYVAAVVDGPVLVTAWDGRQPLLLVARRGRRGAGVDRRLVGERPDRAGHASARSPRPIRARTRSPAGSASTAPGGAPSTASLALDQPGWVLVCSDGLWNYCSSADDVRALVGERVADVGADPLAVASSLCDLGQRTGRPRQRHRRARPPTADLPTDRPHQTRTHQERLMAEWNDRSLRERVPRRRRDRRARDRVDHVQRCRDRRAVGCRGRGHHRRHLGIDVVAAHQDQSARAKRPRRRSTRSSTARGSRSSPATHGADARVPHDPGRWRATRARRRRTAVQRLRRRRAARPSGRGSTRPSTAVRERRGDAAPRHPAHRRQERVESTRPCSTARVEAAQGVFQCDCRGVGADWDVNELRDISSALLGTVDIIAEPERHGRRLPPDDAHVDGAGRRRRHAAGVGTARRRGGVRPPGRADDRGPHRPRASQVGPLIREFPTGSWGDESRDYHVAVQRAAEAARRRAARGAGAARRRRRGGRPGPGEGDLVRRHAR